MLTAWASADMLVVNSAAEATLLKHDAGRLPPISVAHSGVAEDAFDGDRARGQELVGIGSQPFVLSVARVEPRKNNLALALALSDLPCRLVLVGAVLPGNESYFTAVRRAAPDVVHISHLEHRDLRHVHAAATVHALPSWYETTGLSTCEALAAGTPVVVGESPCVREYFDGCAAFCSPASVRDVRKAILNALEGPLGCERSCAERYSWDRTARELVAAYRSLPAGQI
jgi:glycosyltransferase involved in cell wall biosynthesis